MKLYPAIDVLSNRAVRLLYGKRGEVTDYGTPLERAEKWCDCGAKRLHVVDLNGAFDNDDTNDKTIRELIKTLVNNRVEIEIGGGIKTYDRVKYYLDELGASRVIIGSALITDEETALRSYSEYGERIVAGIDAENGKVRINGWVDEVSVTPLDLARKLRGLGARDVVFTDISRDGALSGVNIKASAELQRKSELNVIASGGVNGMDDLYGLHAEGVYGVILGRSIYIGNIDLKEAILEFERG